MEDVNQVIAKMILAGAVKLEEKAPMFTREFIDYVPIAFAKNPGLDETVTGWRQLFAEFHPSLAALTLRELGILSALVSFELAHEGNQAASAE
jgi:hypothetical protein